MINNTTGSLIVHQGYITTRFKYTVCTTALMYIHLLLKYFISPRDHVFLKDPRDHVLWIRITPREEISNFKYLFSSSNIWQLAHVHN
jgi:hypothetical protein